MALLERSPGVTLVAIEAVEVIALAFQLTDAQHRRLLDAIHKILLDERDRCPTAPAADPDDETVYVGPIPGGDNTGG